MDIHFETLGEKEEPVFLWAHGWGQSSKAFTPLAGSFTQSGRHVMVDLPGFGKTQAPDTVWSTEDYADAIASFMDKFGAQKVIWVGHSFGCRVGIRMAAKYPERVRGLFLIAAPGLPRSRSLWQKLYFKFRVALFKFLKKLIPFGLPEEWLMKTFASPDYKNAGPMRNILVKTVNENLSEPAQQISCPVALVYGVNDTETPPELGEKYHKLIPDSELVHLEAQDHYSVLSEGRHQVARYLKEFLTRLAP